MSEIVVVHGYVGSGKSTHCSQLASDGLGETLVQHISAGDLLRGIRAGTVLSGFSRYINAPDAPSPLPDWVVEGAIFEALDDNGDSLALIDGYPRHPQAVESFCMTVSDKQHLLLGTIAMQLAMDASVERIAARGKRDGERTRDADIREFARYRYQLDLQVTNLAIDALGKVAPVRFVDAAGDIPTVYSKFIEGIRYLRRQHLNAL